MVIRLVLFLITTLLNFLPLHTAKYLNLAEKGPKSPFNQSNTVILFDFHDVIVHKDILLMGKCILKYRNPFSNISSKDAKLELQIARKNGYSADAYVDICNNYHLHKNAQAFNALGHAYYIKDEMITLLEELKDQGYTLLLASNIGQSGLNGFLNYSGTNKDRNHIAQALKLFDDYFVVDYTQKNVLLKPNPIYFQNLKKKYPQWKYYIFVDDKSENIKMSSVQGMIGLKFNSTEKLKNEFFKLGILGNRKIITRYLTRRELDLIKIEKT